MKVNNKKHTKKLLSWLASISLFAVGAMAITPMATACSNTPPEPWSPIDKSAYEAKESDILYSNNSGLRRSYVASLANFPQKDKVVFNRNNFERGFTGVIKSDDEADKLINNFKYIEFGENIAEKSGITGNDRAFFIGDIHVENCDMIIVHKQKFDTTYNCCVYFGTSSLDTEYIFNHNNKAFYFDFDFKDILSIGDVYPTDEPIPEPKIYLNKNNQGTISEWSTTLGLNEKCFELI